jgi:DNA-binding NarL/FixJ family response regulator
MCVGSDEERHEPIDVEVRLTSSIRVLLVALDGGAARSNLATAADFELECVSSFSEAALSLRDRAPHVLVVALRNAELRDVSLLRALHADSSIPLLVCTPPVRQEVVVDFIKAGAGGLLFEPDTKHMASAVRELLRGGVPMSAPVSEVVLQRARRSSATMVAAQPSPHPPATLLTERQLEMLGHLQHGHSYEDIATALGLSVNTVRSHVRSVYERLGVSSKVEAVMVAMELGLLQRTRFTSQFPPKP